MPKFSIFQPFGHFKFSSRKPHGQLIYESMKRNLGPDFNQDFHSLVQTHIYAEAMGLASAKYTIDRAYNNANPLKCTELLAVHERDHLIVPPPTASLHERRRTLAARMKLSRGPRRENVEDLLRTLLGSAFIRYETTEPVDQVVWPPSPGTVGNFVTPRVPKLFRTLAPISLTGVQQTISVAALNGSSKLLPGEFVAVEPNAFGRPERVQVVGATLATITTTFTKAHDTGVAITNQTIPMITSDQRYAMIVVTFAAATDRRTRASINDIMRRVACGVSQWGIVHDDGVFSPGVGSLGVIPGAAARP